MTRRYVWAAGLAVITGWLAYTAPSIAQPPAAAEKALLAAEDRLFEADVHRDTAAVEQGFADEAVFVHANGMIQSKSDYIKAMASGAFPIKSINTENRIVRIFGTVGVVRGIKSLVVGDMHLSGSYLTVYVMRDGRWQMLDEQSAPAQKPSNSN